MKFVKCDIDLYAVYFTSNNRDSRSISGTLNHVLKTIVNETSIDVETVTLSGYNVVQPD